MQIDVIVISSKMLLLPVKLRLRQFKIRLCFITGVSCIITMDFHFPSCQLNDLPRRGQMVMRFNLLASDLYTVGFSASGS